MKYVMIIFFSIIFAGGYFGMVYMHEQAHVQIFATYGIQSEVHMFKNFPHATTSADVDDYKARCKDNCMLSNDINEMMFYPIQFIYLIIGVGLLCLIFLKELEIESLK